MQQIGYSLIDSTGAEIRYWGDQYGVFQVIPSLIRLPNGDDVHCPAVGNLADWWLVPRMGQRGVGDTYWDGTNVVVFFPVKPDDVRAEAQRRIIAVTGATSFDGCLVKQLNAVMRATELTNKKASGGTLTAGEVAEATALQALADQIKHIRACSNVMEQNPPTDYTDNARWGY